MDMKDLYEKDSLCRITSISSSSDDESVTYELDDLVTETAILAAQPVERPRWWYRSPWRRLHRRRSSKSTYLGVYAPRRRRSLRTRIVQLITLIPYALSITIIICAIIFPSYTNPPQRYDDLRKRVHSAELRPNANNEKIFIAASVYDHEGELLSGDWGKAVLYLIDILGHNNVFLSIYEDNPDDMARKALEEFTTHLRCESAIVSESLDLHDYPHVVTADGRQLLKRIAFLADVRNRALRPLDDTNSSAYHTPFDKLLYLNDVIFDPVDAANLLLSTNVDESSGRTNYRAACAVDFINPFKFYDTFATRDLEGYDMGVPFYPWFTNAGKAESRRDVLAQKDAVRVKSCWGGMVAFEAKWFQQHLYSIESEAATSPARGLIDSQLAGSPSPASANTGLFSNATSSLRFRSDMDTYWDSSECCLIHADLMSMDLSATSEDTGIYMNPYIRVAYSSSVLPWLSFTRRFERLYTPIQRIVNWIGNRPSYNPRQFHESGEEVTDKVWLWDTESDKIESANPQSQHHGQFKQVHRVALPGGFCGMRKLLYINENAGPDEAKWGFDSLPPGST